MALKNPSKLSSYRESYRASFPVQEESVDFLQVPTLDDTVESLLVKKHGHKAVFGSTPSLYNCQLRSIEKIGFQGQSAARMGVIMTCYTQKALGIFLENLQSENPNIDRAIQTTRDVFAMTTKSLDQVARAGAFHHMSRRKAAVYDTRLDEYKDYASTIMALPFTSEGVFGSQFDDKLKSKQERFKQIAEVLPELDNSNRNAKSVAGKRKAATSSYSNDKRRRYSNDRPRNSGYSGGYGSGGRSNWSTGRGRGSYRGRGATVSSFRAQTKSSWLSRNYVRVSRNTCRGSFEKICKPLGKKYKRQVGTRNIEQGYKIRIWGISQANGDKTTNICTCSEFRNLLRRGSKFITKRGYNTCTFCRKTSRFLQYAVSIKKENGRSKTSDKLETTQQLPGKTSFQNGHSSKSSELSSRERLGSFSRSKGCLFSYPSTSITPKVPTVLLPRIMFSISSNVLRTHTSPSSVYKGCISSSSTPSYAQHTSSSIPRRLACRKQDKTSLYPRSRESVESSLSPGLHYQCQEISVSTMPRNSLPGQSVQTKSRPSLPHKDRIQSLVEAMHTLTACETASAMQFLRVLGIMASCIELIPYARLRMRPIQIHLLHFWKPASKDLDFQVPITQHLKEHLHWWFQPANTLKGMFLHQWCATKILTTDASKTGYGAHLEGQCYQGTWSKKESSLHINVLELEAVHRALVHFLPVLKNQKVLVRSDNVTVVQYLNKQGGTRSPNLCFRVWNLFLFAIQNQIELRAAHIAGKLNVLADHLSRKQIRPSEWSINNQVINQIFALWNKPLIDLFASAQNHKTPVFCTWFPSQEALAVDALSIPWEGMFAYAFPPIGLILKVLEHMSQYNCQLMLIVPLWPRRHWYTKLLQLVIDFPRSLPLREDLLISFFFSF